MRAGRLLQLSEVELLIDTNYHEQTFATVDSEVPSGAPSVHYLQRPSQLFSGACNEYDVVGPQKPQQFGWVREGSVALDAWDVHSDARCSQIVEQVIDEDKKQEG